MAVRPITELMMRTTNGSIGFTKAQLSTEEVDYLKGLSTFLVETDEFIFTRNPVIVKSAPPVEETAEEGV